MIVMKKKAQEIAKKYSVDYDELVGRGKSHDIQAARRELVYELVQNDFDIAEISEFLGNRSTNTVTRLYESFSGREDNKRKPR